MLERPKVMLKVVVDVVLTPRPKEMLKTKTKTKTKRELKASYTQVDRMVPMKMTPLHS